MALSIGVRVEDAALHHADMLVATSCDRGRADTSIPDGPCVTTHSSFDLSL